MAEMTKEQMKKLLESDADRTRGFTQEEMEEMQQELENIRSKRFKKSLPEDKEMKEDPRPNRFQRSIPDDDEIKEEFSPGLEEDRTAPLKGDALANLKEVLEETVDMAEGGSIEKEADFVKDDDEEPNDPPPGAKPEEVADDIPAYLSTGEYVLPANVVRYLGLERIVSMHKGALAALQQMEDLDIIENVDENGMVEEDDDEMDYLKKPKGVVKTTLVVAKPHPSGMMAMPFAEGGAPGGPDDTGAAPDEDTFADPGQDDTLGEEDEGFEISPSPPATAEPGGVPDEKSDPIAAFSREKDPADERSFIEAFSDFFTKSQPRTREQKPVTDKALNQYMLANPDLTRDQAMKDLEEFAFQRTTPPQDVAKTAGLLAGVAQSFFNKLEDEGFTITPNGEYDQRQEDQGLGPGGGSDDQGVITEKKLDDDDDDADDSDDTNDFVFQPGVGFIPRRRFLRRVQTLKEGDLPTARKGGLMGQ